MGREPMWPYDETEARWLSDVPVSRSMGKTAREPLEAVADLGRFAKHEFLSTMAMAVPPARRWWRQTSRSGNAPLPARLDPGLRQRG